MKIETIPATGKPFDSSDLEIVINSEGVKYDSNKPSPSLLPMKPLLEVVKVLDFGAKKYQKNGWTNVPNGNERYLNALWRHLIAFTDGEDNDSESGISHMAHIACNALFLIHLNKREQ